MRLVAERQLPGSLRAANAPCRGSAPPPFRRTDKASQRLSWRTTRYRPKPQRRRPALRHARQRCQLAVGETVGVAGEPSCDKDCNGPAGASVQPPQAAPIEPAPQQHPDQPDLDGLSHDLPRPNSRPDRTPLCFKVKGVRPPLSRSGHYRLAGGRVKDALRAPLRGRAAPGPGLSCPLARVAAAREREQRGSLGGGQAREWLARRAGGRGDSLGGRAVTPSDGTGSRCAAANAKIPVRHPPDGVGRGGHVATPFRASWPAMPPTPRRPTCGARRSDPGRRRAGRCRTRRRRGDLAWR